jgi:hypothetical protein
MLAAAGWPQTGIPHIVPPPPMPGGTVIPSGTELAVRVDETLSTNQNQRGDRFTATLTDPVVVNGVVVLAPGTRFTGQVLDIKPAGILKGWAGLTLALDSFEWKGHRFSIELTSATCVSPHKHQKLESPDPNAGAAVGDREQATIRAETILHFTLGSPVRV